MIPGWVKMFVVSSALPRPRGHDHEHLPPPARAPLRQGWLVQWWSPDRSGCGWPAAAEEVAAAVPQYRELFEAVETQFPGASARERFHEGLRQLIDLLVSGLIEGTVAAAGESGATTADEVRACAGRLASFTPEVALTSRALKTFLLENVYATPALGAGRQQSQELISNLFQFFLENPARLPQPYADQALDEPAHRVVCDYIAGMTDAFLRRTYELMLGPVPTLPLA